MLNHFRTEKNLRLWLARKLGGIWQSIEDMQGVGVPDCNYCTSSPPLVRRMENEILFSVQTEGWLELKVIKMPKSNSTMVKVGLRPEQCGWLTRWKSAGGKCGVLIGTDRGELFLVVENFQKLLRKMTVSNLKKISIEYTDDPEVLREYL
jgi:hypothetical protein